MDKMFNVETKENNNEKETKKGKERLYEEIEFANNIAYATQVKKESEEKLKKISKVWIISIIGSICGFFGFTFQPCLVVSFILACICYFNVGGYKVAVTWSWKFAKFGWYIVPFFPWDLLCGFIAFVFGLYALFFMPYFTVNHTKKQLSMNLEAANTFLNSYQQVQAAHSEQ